MKRKAKRMIIVFFMIAILIIPAFCMAETPLLIRLMTGEGDAPIRMILSEVKVHKYSPFDDQRTEHLNRLIQHLGLEITLGGDISRTGIRIDGNEILSWVQKEDGDGTQTIYSFDPGIVYRSKADEEEAADPDSIVTFLEEELIRANRDMETWYTLFENAPAAFSDRVKTEKTELRFSGFGRAIKRVTILFPANYVQESFPKALADAAGTESLKNAISGMTFEGSQKIGLLYDENDRIVRITYDGKVGKTPETVRKVSLIWKCLRDDGHVKDSITLKTPAVTGADKDNIALERDLLEPTEEEPGSYKWDMQIDHRAGKEDRKQTHFIADLNETEGTLGGKIEYSYKREGENPKIRIVPEIRKESDGEYKGTLEIADYSGKIEKDDVLIHIQLQTGESLSWPAEGTGQGTGNHEQEKPEDTLAAILIQKLFELPKEDLEYFSHEIPADLWLELIQ